MYFKIYHRKFICLYRMKKEEEEEKKKQDLTRQDRNNCFDKNSNIGTFLV